jgi:3-methyladenine DNA glycosylase AlkD
MLRELGKQDLGALREFLETNVKNMPRTMLRYAIEKMSERERREWLKR